MCTLKVQLVMNCVVPSLPVFKMPPDPINCHLCYRQTLAHTSMDVFKEMGCLSSKRKVKRLQRKSTLVI